MSERSNQAGFSYLDVLVAVTILLVGVLALVGAMTSAVVMTTDSEQQLVAKQYASSSLEAIFSARDISLPGFGYDAIGNLGDPGIPGGIFLAGRQQIWPSAGLDGVIGTGDDDDGPDGVAASGDEGASVDGFEREIVIQNIVDPAAPVGAPITLRSITVNIHYSVNGKQRQESFTSAIANYNK